MDDLAELHDKALEATGRIVSRVRANQWHAATPCADWNVRELVNHLVVRKPLGCGTRSRCNHRRCRRAARRRRTR